MLSASELKHCRTSYRTITDTVTSKTIHSDCCTDFPLITVPYHPKKAWKNSLLTLKEKNQTSILAYDASMATT